MIHQFPKWTLDWQSYYLLSLLWLLYSIWSSRWHYRTSYGSGSVCCNTSFYMVNHLFISTVTQQDHQMRRFGPYLLSSYSLMYLLLKLCQFYAPDYTFVRCRVRCHVYLHLRDIQHRWYHSSFQLHICFFISYSLSIKIRFHRLGSHFHDFHLTPHVSLRIPLTIYANSRSLDYYFSSLALNLKAPSMLIRAGSQIGSFAPSLLDPCQVCPGSSPVNTGGNWPGESCFSRGFLWITL